MKNKHPHALTLVAAALAMAQAPAAWATNGYFLTGSGYRAQGMGGVGIAYGRDALSIGANPANVVNTGMRGDMGFGVFNAELYAATGESANVLDTDGNPSVGGFSFDRGSASDGKYFLVPEMGMTMNFSERFSLGVAFLGGGLATSYPVNLYSWNPQSATRPDVPNARHDKIGVEMYQLQVPVTFGYKLNEDHSVGAALNLALTRFRAYGLGAFVLFDQPLANLVPPGDPFGLGFAITSDPANLTNRGMDYSFGAGFKLGWLGEFLDDKLTLGASYTSRTYMTKFDKYRGLFAEQGDFDIPEHYGVGITLKPTNNLIVSAEVTRINYAKVASIGNPGPGVAKNLSGEDVVRSTTASPPGSGAVNNQNNQTNGIPSVLDGKTNGSTGGNNSSALETGNDQGMGFGWDNMTVYKLGVQYGLNKRWQLRAGYNYSKSPVADNQLTFNVLAPAVVEKHYSAGFTYKHSEELEITGTYVYAEPASQTSGPYQNVVGAATANMHQNLFAVSLGWVLDPGLRDYGDDESEALDFTNFYLGVSGGHSYARGWGNRDFEAAFAQRGFPATSTSTDNMSSAFKGYVGYQFNKRFGVEAGYVDLNDVRANTRVAGGDPNVYTVLDHDAWFAALVARQPLFGSLSGLMKLGVSAWSAEMRVKDTYTVSDPGTGPSLPGSNVLTRGGEKGYGLHYGVGLAYGLTDNIEARFEWERYEMDAVQDVGGDVDLYSFGMGARF